MGYFACHSNYISYMVCCSKYNETCMGEDSTAPENKNEFQKRQHYPSYTIKTFHCQRIRVKNDLYMSWWNSKVVFVPFSNMVCVGGSRRQISPVESCHFTRGSCFSRANSLTGTIAGLTEHTWGSDCLSEAAWVTVWDQETPSPNTDRAAASGDRDEAEDISAAQQEDICQGRCFRVGLQIPNAFVKPFPIITLIVSFISKYLTVSKMLSHFDPPSNPIKCVRPILF